MYRERLGHVEQAVERTQGQVIDLAQARAERDARQREQAERQAEEQGREREQAARQAQEREAQAREQAERQAQEAARERDARAREQAEREIQAQAQLEREGQERTRERTPPERLSPEEAARVERVLAQEPGWRAEQEAARVERLMAQLEAPEARVADVLQRYEVWREAQLEQARQELERDTGLAHTFAEAGRVTGRLVDRVELGGEDFGRVQDREDHMLLVPWTREMERHLERSVALQLDAARHVTRVLAEAPRREWDLGLDRGG
jgi:hypothetical protein